MFKKLKLKKKEREREKKKVKLHCKSPTQRQRFITTIKKKYVTEGVKVFRTLSRLYHANKINNYNKGEEGKISKRIYRTIQNTRIINVFLASLLSESFPSLEVTIHLTSLGCPPTLNWSLDLLWGGSDSNLVLPLCVLVFSVHSYQS